jgi:hypothetical protein
MLAYIDVQYLVVAVVYLFSFLSCAFCFVSLGLVSCAPNIASFSRFFILDFPFIKRLLKKEA